MTKQGTIALIILLAIVAGAGFLIFRSSNTPTRSPVVTNFEECAQAGYTIMTTYPVQCRTANGEVFIQTIPNPNTNPNMIPADNTSSGKCYTGGCSGQICSEEQGIASTCEYREEYACYKSARCERQASGQCGWTQTPQLSACLLDAKSTTASGHVSGHVSLGPNCPVEREGEPCEPSPEAYTSREVLVYASNGTTVKYRVFLDTNGNYKMSVAPGNYFIQISPAGIGPGEKKPVTVKPNQTTVINFDIDTGIR